MRKIGILTFHRAYNFGAVLQSYAVQKAVRTVTNDSDVCIIDYRCNRIEKWFHSKSIKSKLKNIYRFCLHHNYYKELATKEELFNAFTNKYLQLSPQYTSWKEFYDCFDAIIVGSDQVWNLDMTQNDINYFLPYNKGAKKYSYAASFGRSAFSEMQNEIVRTYLSKFDSVLIREEAGIQIANSFGVKGQKVVDPTLLVQRDHWETLCEPCNVTKPYVLLYIVAKETYSISLAKKIAQENGWDVIYVDPPRFNIDGIIRMKTAGPSQFLWLIKHARLVITTSYHGLIFSMNMNTPFLYEMAHVEENTNSRLEEVAITYNLHSFAIQSDNTELYSKVVYDWDRINKAIEENRSTSMKILRQSINMD